jgi:hypothetical protein
MQIDRHSAIHSEFIESKKRWHRAQVSLPIREKVRILLALQRQDFAAHSEAARFEALGKALGD